MKKNLRIVSLLSIVALYSSIMSLCSSSLFSQSIDNSKQINPTNQQYYFFSSSNAHNQIAEKESSVSFCSNIPITIIKNSFKNLSATAKAIEQFFFSTYSQYSFFSQYLLIRLLQTDIVFPFHYFW